MNNEEQSDLRDQLASLDSVPAEPVPAGWSRRSWVQREALAFAAAAESMIRVRREPAAE